MTTRITAARSRALFAGTTFLILAAACAKQDATPATTASAGTNAATSTPSAMTQTEREDLHDAIRGYHLTSDNVDKVIQATQKMHALQKAHPELAAAMDRENGTSDARTIDELASRLDAMPPVKAVLSSVGLSARDYVLTTFTLMEAGAAYQFQKAGKLPPNSALAKDVSAENMAYVGTHQSQLQALEQANAASEDE